MNAHHNTRLMQSLLETRTLLAFRGILGVLDALPDPSQTQPLIDYAAKELSSWADSLRCVDMNDLPLSTIVNSNGWRLVRTIRCDQSLENVVSILDDQDHSLVGISLHAYEDSDLAALAQSRLAERLESLDITIYDVSGESLRKLLSRLSRLTSLSINVTPQHESEVWNAINYALPDLQLHSLEVSGIPSGFAQELFSHCPPTLTKLGLFRLSCDDLNALCRSESLCSQVRVLTLERNHIGNEGLAAIATSPYFNCLEVLQLPHNDISIEGIVCLRNAKFLRSLRELDLSDNPIGDQGVAAIVDTPFDSIDRLIIADANITAQGCHSIRDADHLARLSVLKLDVNEITDAGVFALVDAPALKNLVSLGIGVNGITIKGIKSLSKAERLSNLRNLWLDGNNIRGGEIQPLVQSSFINTIRFLDVGNCALGDEGALAIAKGKWSCIQSLNLWNCGIGDLGVSAIADSLSLSQLLDLNLLGGKFKDVGIESLATSTQLQNLVRLVIGDVDCTDEAMTKLANSDVVRLVDEIGISSHFESWLLSSSLRPIAKEYVRKAQRELDTDDV